MTKTKGTNHSSPEYVGNSDISPYAGIPSLDEKITTQAESAYERLVREEGFSDEQALNIAMTRVGKAGGDLELDDEDETDGELRVHDSEVALGDLLEDLDGGSENEPSLGDRSHRMTR